MYTQHNLEDFSNVQLFHGIPPGCRKVRLRAVHKIYGKKNYVRSQVQLYRKRKSKIFTPTLSPLIIASISQFVENENIEQQTVD